MCYIHGDNDKDRRCDDRHESDDDKDCMSDGRLDGDDDKDFKSDDRHENDDDKNCRSDDRLNGDDGLLAEVGSR